MKYINYNTIIKEVDDSINKKLNKSNNLYKKLRIMQGAVGGASIGSAGRHLFKYDKNEDVDVLPYGLGGAVAGGLMGYLYHKRKQREKLKKLESKMK